MSQNGPWGQRLEEVWRRGRQRPGVELYGALEAGEAETPQRKPGVSL